jgi:rubrerythrin
MASKDLRGSKTSDNLKAAFAGEAQANRRYLYFARLADSEGYTDVAELFREVAQHETGHAFGHMRFLKQVADPVTGLPIGSSRQNLASCYEGETYEATQMYPGFAAVAREEGFEELAKWFDSLAKVERSHAELYRKALESLT